MRLKRSTLHGSVRTSAEVPHKELMCNDSLRDQCPWNSTYRIEKCFTLPDFAQEHLLAMPAPTHIKLMFYPARYAPLSGL